MRAKLFSREVFCRFRPKMVSAAFSSWISRSPATRVACCALSACLAVLSLSSAIAFRWASSRDECSVHLAQGACITWSKAFCKQRGPQGPGRTQQCTQAGVSTVEEDKCHSGQQQYWIPGGRQLSLPRQQRNLLLRGLVFVRPEEHSTRWDEEVGKAWANLTSISRLATVSCDLNSARTSSLWTRTCVPRTRSGEAIKACEQALGHLDLMGDSIGLRLRLLVGPVQRRQTPQPFPEFPDLQPGKGENDR